MILALETATNICSVAFFDGERIHEKRVEQRGSHSEQLFLFIEELREEHGFSIPDLDAVLVSEGPGSYTGLRISASAVKGLLFQADVPLYGINTLASFAMQALREYPAAKTIHSIINARRVHVYHQQFTASPLTSGDEVSITPIEELEEHYDVEIPREKFDTVGGYLINLFGHVPVPGEELRDGSLHMTVVDSDERKISKVRIHLIQTEQDES